MKSPIMESSGSVVASHFSPHLVKSKHVKIPSATITKNAINCITQFFLLSLAR